MKILIIRLSAFGDVVQGIPCLVALKESFPEWEISWLVEDSYAPILQGHPYLKNLFVLRRHNNETRTPSKKDIPDQSLAIWPMRRALQAEDFDVAIDLQGLFKSGVWTWLSGAPHRMGHNRTREFAHLFLNQFAGDRPVFDPTFPLIQRYLEPAQYLGADIRKAHYLLPPPSIETISEVNSLINEANTLSSVAVTLRPAIALCPWSAWPSKNWPITRWKEIASVLSDSFRLFLIGTASDLTAANKLCSDLPHVTNLVGKTSLRTLGEVFRRCQIVIGPDSGPIHLANATGIPRVIMLFGSTSWQRSGPVGEGHRVLSTHLSCQPCFKRICPLRHLNCQQFLEPKQVLAAVYELAGTSK